MSKINIKVTGLDKLEKKLKKDISMNQVKDVVKKNGADLQTKIQENADFKGHMEGNKFVSPTGTTKRSVGLELKDGGFTAESGPKTDYAPYLELGTRFMDAQPFVEPALDEVGKNFKDDMKELVR